MAYPTLTLPCPLSRLLLLSSLPWLILGCDPAQLTDTPDDSMPTDLAMASTPPDASQLPDLAFSCNDKQKNGTETDVDCGGGRCGGCRDGLRCLAHRDCTSAHCVGFVCVDACHDGTQDGTESGVDCGGSCAPCTDGTACAVDGDCQSATCRALRCIPATCANKVTDGTETDVDCGGSCPACGGTMACKLDADCQSARCGHGACAYAVFDLESVMIWDIRSPGWLADIDGDGGPDLVSLVTGAFDVRLGDGAGHFGAPVHSLIAMANQTVSLGPLAFGDLDGDGKADVALNASVNGSPFWSTYTMRAGKGGALGAPALFMGGDPPALAIGDFDGDGKADLFVPDAHGGYVIWLSDGNGGYKLGPLRNALFGGITAIETGNFDGDATTDLVFSDLYNNRVFTITKNNTQVFKTGGHPWTIGVGDFDGDGLQDFATANVGSMDLSVFFATGKGNFTDAVSMAQGASPPTVVAGDWNGDKLADLAVSRTNTDTVDFYFSAGKGKFAPPVTYVVPGGPVAMYAGDLNRDGRPDLVLQNSQNSTFNGTAVALSLPDGMHAATSLRGVAPYLTGMAVADADGDGSLDLLYSASQGGGVGRLSVALNNGKGAFPSLVSYGDQNGGSVATGDLNGDKRVDAVVAIVDDSTINVYLNAGAGKYTQSGAYKATGRPHVVAIADLDGDGLQDAVSGAYNGDVNLFINQGAGAFNVTTAFGAGLLIRAIQTADLDGDGRIDLVLARDTMNAGDPNLVVLMNMGKGVFAAGAALAADNAHAIAVGDLDGDGKPEVVTAGDLGVTIFANQGGGKLAAAKPIGEQNAALVTICNVNGDQNPDIAVSGPYAPLFVLLGKGALAFDESPLFYGGDAIALVAADLDGDHKTDFVVADSFHSINVVTNLSR